MSPNNSRVGDASWLLNVSTATVIQKFKKYQLSSANLKLLEKLHSKQLEIELIRVEGATDT